MNKDETPRQGEIGFEHTDPITVPIGEGSKLRAVRTIDWKRLRRLVERICPPSARWKNAAWACVGITASAAVGFITVVGNSAVAGWQKSLLGLIGFFGVAGALLYFATHRFAAKIMASSANAVVEDMDDIAALWDASPV